MSAFNQSIIRTKSEMQTLILVLKNRKRILDFHKSTLMTYEPV